MLDRELVLATPRKPLLASTRSRIMARSGCMCARVKCRSWATEIDHIVSLWMGGADEESNMEALCEEHHKIKTRIDASARAKVKRLIAAQLPQPPPPKPKRVMVRDGRHSAILPMRIFKQLKGRAFQTKFRRKMDGTVVRRV